MFRRGIERFAIRRFVESPDWFKRLVPPLLGAQDFGMLLFGAALALGLWVGRIAAA